MNLRNYGSVTGRVVSISFFPMTAGEIARFKIAVHREYVPARAKEPPTDFLEMTAFIRSENGDRGVYSMIRKGDLLTVQYTLQSSTSEKNGERRYFQTCVVEHLELLETRAVRDARQKERQEETATSGCSRGLKANG